MHHALLEILFTLYSLVFISIDSKLFVILCVFRVIVAKYFCISLYPFVTLVFFVGFILFHFIGIFWKDYRLSYFVCRIKFFFHALTSYILSLVRIVKQKTESVNRLTAIIFVN